MAAKTHYKVSNKIEAFFAGGAISLSKDGELIACAYYDEVKVVASVKASADTNVKILAGARQTLFCRSFIQPLGL